MKILPIKFNYTQNHINRTYFTPPKSQTTRPEAFTRVPVNYYSQITFTSEDLEYKKAKQYLSNEIKEHRIPYKMKDLDLDKLNGIQNGIKIFEGMNAKEIAFICDNLNEIAIYRGCSGYCGHCYANAVSQIKEDNKHINKMSFEDYKMLTNGFKTLRQRLGFNPYNSSYYYDMALFRDADCMEIELKDKKGNTYDFIDLANMANDAFKKKILFDTRGWSKSNKKMQERAEKFVKYYSNPKNADKLSQINISINPFNWLNMQAVKALNKNDLEKAQLNINAYTSRMANVLFTFTPLLKNKKFDIIVRAFSDDLDADFAEGYNASYIRNLNYIILQKLARLYKQDLNGEQKVIKSEQELIKNINKFYFLLTTEIETNLTLSGRIRDLIPPNHPNQYNLIREQQNEIIDDYIFNINEELFNNDNFTKTINANGQIYITNPIITIPTDLRLNLENKDKLTQKFAPDEYPTLSRKIINKAVIDD